MKSSSRFVVSLSLYERRGVGEGVRSDRRTVEGVICGRGRGVALERVSTALRRVESLSLTSLFFEGLFLMDANLVMSRPGISEKSLKRVSSMSGVVASGLKSVMSASMLTSYCLSCDFRLL